MSLYLILCEINSLNYIQATSVISSKGMLIRHMGKAGNRSLNNILLLGEQIWPSSKY